MPLKTIVNPLGICPGLFLQMIRGIGVSDKEVLETLVGIDPENFKKQLGPNELTKGSVEDLLDSLSISLRAESGRAQEVLQRVEMISFLSTFQTRLNWGVALKKHLQLLQEQATISSVKDLLDRLLKETKDLIPIVSLDVFDPLKNPAIEMAIGSLQMQGWNLGLWRLPTWRHFFNKSSKEEMFICLEE